MQQITKSMKTKLLIAALGLAPLTATIPQSARAADIPLFNPAHYGKTVLPLSESLGNSADIIHKQGSTFEPVSRLRRDDPVRLRARAIGRLDLLIEQDGKRALSTCTASIVASDLLLTNYHCIPGLGVKILKASFLLDYEKADGSGTKRLRVEPRALEGNKDLDYAIARISDPVPADVQPLVIDPMLVKPGQRLLMIHHPAGQVKKMSAFSCYAAPSTPQNSAYLRHICDTLPGSSGGILFNRTSNAVGLHHTGGLDKNNPESFNKGTLFARLVAASQKLKGKRSGAPGNAPTPTYGSGSTGASGSINDFLARKEF